MAHHYIDETLTSDAFAVGALVRLGGAEAKHAVTVSRVRVGESVQFGNGSGLVARATVKAASASLLELEIDEVRSVPAPRPRLALVQALAKGDRDELAVQAATELGVDEIVPWQASRSISRWEGIKAVKGRGRWASIVREAGKQSMRPWLPPVGELVSTRQLAALASSRRLLVLEPSAETPMTALDLDERDIAVVVGPEGGVSSEELAQLVAAGAEPVVLGDSVLRTSTAGPAAIAVLSARLGRW